MLQVTASVTIGGRETSLAIGGEVSMEMQEVHETVLFEEIVHGRKAHN